MAIADVLSEVGKGVGAVAGELGKGIANEEAGYAPEIAREKRAHAQKLEDEQIGAQAKLLESRLDQLQSNAPLYNADGSAMTPQQRTQAISDISNKYTQLYSHPRHAATLMEKLRKAVHPKGAVAGPSATPASAMQGFTAAAPPGTSEEQKRQEHMKDIDFWTAKLQAMGIPPDQINAARNEAIERAMGAITGNPHEKTPKGLKAMEQGGVFFGIQDQDTGKQYLKAQLEPGGDAPPEAKAMYQSVMKAAEDKQAAADKKVEEQNERQLRMFAHSFELQARAITQAISLGDYKEARKELTKADEAYQASLDRMNTMDRAAVRAKNEDQQAQFAVLSNHIAMTLQQPQVSARPTKAMFDEAAGSLPWMQKIKKTWDSDGYLSGLTLSADQVDKMVDLAHQKAEVQKEHVDRVKKEHESDLAPETATGKPAKRGQLKTLTSPLNGDNKSTVKNAVPPKEGDTKVNSHGDRVVFHEGKWGLANAAAN